MRGELLLRQIRLFAVLWLLNYQGVSEFSEAKTLSNREGGDESDFAPVVTEHPTSKSIKEGKGLSLVCAAKGKPKPRIKWKKNGRTITVTTDNRIKIRPYNSGLRLRIRDSIPGDSGDYHCVAKNYLGHANSIKARVEVKRKMGPVSNGGTCEPYRGRICLKYISSDNRTFIPHNKTQMQLEERVLFATSILREYTHSSCKDLLVKALCHNLFPPCETGNSPSPQLLCKESCEVLQAATCSREFHLLERRLGTLSYETIPDCSLLSDGASCLHVGNKTNPGRECRQENGDVPEVKIKPFSKSYPVCRDITIGSRSTLPQRGKSLKNQNKEILRLVRHVKSEIFSGKMFKYLNSNEVSTYCFTASLPFDSLVRGWNVYAKTLLLPNLRRPNNITVPGLIVSTRNLSVSEVLVPLGSAEKYKVHEKVVLKNVEFYYRLQSGHGSFIAKGDYNLCGTVFRLTVETAPGGNIKIKGFSDLPIDLSKIESIFVHVSPSPSNRLVAAIRKVDLFVLRLMRPAIEAYISDDLVVKFSGHTYFGPSAVPAHLEFFGGRLHGQGVLLAGITSSRFTINDALKMLTGVTVPYFDLLKNSPNSSSVGIVLSANTLDLTKTPYVGFNKVPLHLAFAGAVPRDLGLVTSNSIPAASHNKSQVVKLFQAIIGRGSKYTVKATTDWKSITLDWQFHNVSKKAVSPFDGVEMTFKLDSPNWQGFLSSPLSFMTFFVEGRFYSSGQSSKRLPFTGQLMYEDQNSVVAGNFETEAVWKKAFGIELLTVRKLKLGVSISTNRSQQSKVRGEAELQLGFNCHATRDNSEIDSIKQDCVTANVFMGFSDVSADHFFYGTLPPVSLQKLLGICNIRHKLPGTMATIGFPEGFQISVAREVHDLREMGGPVLRPGFLLKGKMSVMGIETPGVISLLPHEFLVDAKVGSDEAPEMTDDVAPLFSHNLDQESYPKLFLKARMDPVPFVKAHLDGYARFFGIFEEVRMLATRDALRIHLSTDADKSFKISVEITTNYSSHRNHTQFSAIVEFENGFSKLTRMASKQVVSLLEHEISELKSAKREVQRLRRECDKAIRQDCSICTNDKMCVSSLLNCHIDTGTNKPFNGSERKHGPTDTCQRLVMERCLATETACFNACRFVSSKANKTCEAYQVAAASQRKLERGFQWVRRAERFIYSELFQIHAISFKTNVSSRTFEHLFMDTSLEATIFGQKEKLEGLHIKFNEFVNLSSEIAKYAWDWYQKAPPQNWSTPRHPDNRPRPPA